MKKNNESTETDELKKFVFDNIALGLDPYYRDQVLRQLGRLLSTNPSESYLRRQHEQLSARLNIAVAECTPTSRIIIERESVRLALLYRQKGGTSDSA